MNIQVYTQKGLICELPVSSIENGQSIMEQLYDCRYFVVFKISQTHVQYRGRTHTKTSNAVDMTRELEKERKLYFKRMYGESASELTKEIILLPKPPIK